MSSSRFMYRLMVALAVLCVAAGCGSVERKAVTRQADRFFAHLRAGDAAAAYALLAAESREVNALEEFEALTRDNGLRENQGVVWEEAYVDGDYGRVIGAVTTSQGHVRRMEVVAFKQGRRWEIHMVHEPRDPSLGDAGLPAQAEATALARRSIDAFIDAVDAGSMVSFHDQTSSILREQVSVEQFEEGFDMFFELRRLGVNFAELKARVPVVEDGFDIDEDGVLALRGSYPPPRGVQFEQSYIREEGQWRLLGFHFNLQIEEWLQDLPAAADGVLPDPGTLEPFRGMDQQTWSFEVTGATEGPVWGTDVYSDDSILAVAAVHAGVLRAGETGIVTVTILPGRDRYTPSTRHGVSTLPWGQWHDGSFSFGE